MQALTPATTQLLAACSLQRPALPPTSGVLNAQSRLRRAQHLDIGVTKPESLQSKSRLTAFRSSQPFVCMASNSAKTVLVPIGNGSEEMEAVTIIDVMRRAGASVIVASVESDLTVKCSRDIKIVADALMTQIAEEEEFDLIVLPVCVPTSKAQSCTHTSNFQIGTAMHRRAAHQDLKP